MDVSNRIPGWFRGVALILCGAVLVALGAAMVPTLISRYPVGSCFSSEVGGSSRSDAESTFTAAFGDPSAEVRGVWIASVSNINFPSKKGLSADELRAELDDIVKTAYDCRLNTIYFQVRPTADALYKSEIFPVSEFLSGDVSDTLPGGFDPLEYIVEKAHSMGIYVHAWVNPLRVTAGSASSPEHDVEALPERSPARRHPEWTVNYADGRMYFDCGIPEVRALVCDGVAEIVRGYDVDGIIFDDYFYPYPVSGAVFDDDVSYAVYGGDMPRDDWRRDNVNTMVKLCYDTVKDIDKDCSFGVSPFGIWKNDDGTNGGSATSGLESYSALYCDTLAWLEGGYVDYIAPQIYWEFSTKNAPYGALVRWWNSRLSEYPGIGLVIGHGAYRISEWSDEDELRCQIEYARSERAYIGSALYGYAAIKADERDVQALLRELFADEIIYSAPKSNGVDITVSSPESGSYTSYENTYLIGRCDPAYPLYFEGEPVSVTKNGYFSVYTSLEEGENKFEFTQNGKSYTHLVNRRTGGGESAPVLLDSYTAELVSPSGDWSGGGGSEIELKVYAPVGSEVTASLGYDTVYLKPSGGVTSDEKYARETYTGKLTVRSFSEGYDAGHIKITASRAGERATAKSGNIRVLGDGETIPIKTVVDDGNLKVAPNSWYYDDYAPQALGMEDSAVKLENGYYLLRMGGYIPENQVETVQGGYTEAVVSAAEVTGDAENVYITFEVDAGVPMHAYINDGIFYVSLYNCSERVPEVKFSDNMLFSSGKLEGCEESVATYSFPLIADENFYGFDFEYVDGKARVKLGCPTTLASGDTPLESKRIWLDAGHGGEDTGALGADPEYTEAAMNLKIAMLCADKLQALGAEVLLTRDEDITVDLGSERVVMINEADPELVVSIHQNSMEYNVNITTVRGLIALYYADSGKLLAQNISSGTATALSRYERDVTRQRLAMVRNPKFPAALVEVGFITNVEETEAMLYGNGFERAAQGIVDGILSYYEVQQKYVK